MTAPVNTLVPVVPPIFRRILSLFPQQYFRFCFAYGSAVKKQGGVSQSKPMIDMIFTVEDSYGFHSQNILINPHHYSGVRHLGARVITFLQEKLPANVYFNTLIPLREEGIMLKYGIVKQSDLVNDLLDWNHLYLAGRLHKPVTILEKPGNEMDMALKQNLFSALHAAFLILPEYFTERDVYYTITNLSYNGDFRMIFGEDKNKINNILETQVLKFRKLYQPYLKTLVDYVEIPAEGPVDQTCMQDLSTTTRMYHLFQLPSAPQKELIKYWRAHGGRKRRDAEDVLQDLAVNPDAGKMLSHCLSNIVFKSSVEQSLKGILSAGLLKTIKYSNKKIDKMLKSQSSSSTVK